MNRRDSLIGITKSQPKAELNNYLQYKYLHLKLGLFTKGLYITKVQITGYEHCGQRRPKFTDKTSKKLHSFTAVDLLGTVLMCSGRQVGQY